MVNTVNPLNSYVYQYISTLVPVFSLLKCFTLLLNDDATVAAVYITPYIFLSEQFAYVITYTYVLLYTYLDHHNTVAQVLVSKVFPLPNSII